MTKTDQEHLAFVGILLSVALVVNTVVSSFFHPSILALAEAPAQRSVAPTFPPAAEESAAQAAREEADRQAAAEQTRIAAQQAAASEAAAEEAARRAAAEAAREAAEEHQRYLARYLNRNFVPNGGMATVAIAASSGDGGLDGTLASALAKRFKTRGINIVSSLFRSAFVADGLFDQVFDGSTEVLGKLDLGGRLTAVLLARQKVQYSTTPSLDNLVSANVHLEIAAVPVAGGGQSQTWSFTANGAGFRRGDARSMAEERLIGQINDDTNMSLSSVLPNPNP